MTFGGAVVITASKKQRRTNSRWEKGSSKIAGQDKISSNDDNNDSKRLYIRDSRCRKARRGEGQRRSEGGRRKDSSQA